MFYLTKMSKGILILMALCLLFVGGCAQDSDQSSVAESSSDVSDESAESSGNESIESSDIVESSEGDQSDASSDVSDYIGDDVLVSECITMTTDSNEYDRTYKKIYLTIVSSHKDEEISHGDEFLVQYWNGEKWLTFTEGVGCLEPDYTFTDETTYHVSFKRLPVGYEKYRVVGKFSLVPCQDNQKVVAYSNEFTYITE